MGLILRYKNLIAHLVPDGTPGVLLGFIVVVERLRTIIQPFTLRIRLMANITAGHLVLRLLRGQIPKLGVGFWFCGGVEMGLLCLEVLVAGIQAYVFTILLGLYLSEVR